MKKIVLLSMVLLSACNSLPKPGEDSWNSGVNNTRVAIKEDATDLN